MKPETIEAAEAIMGIDFHHDDETAIANGLNNRLRTFQQLRQSEIPVDTEPAIMFKPSLPGKEPKGPATPGAADQVREAAADAEAAGQPRRRRVLAGRQAGGAHRAQARDVHRTDRRCTSRG